MNVLVVDDSPSIRDLVKDILSARGHQVVTAKDGADALSKFAEYKPDVVVLDLAMPVMSGCEALPKLISADKNVRVIMMSALEEEEQIYKYLQNGAVAYITKPFRKEELIKAVEHPRFDNKKYLVTLFSRVADKIQQSLEKMECKATVNLLDTTHMQEEPILRHSDVSKIKVVKKTADRLTVTRPTNLAYTTKFEGRKQGSIISFIKKDDLEFLLGKEYSTNNALEFFNIINLKVLSEFANNLKIELKAQPSKIYDDKKNGGDLAFKEIAKANFEIACDDRKIPLETQLCLGEIVTSKIQ